ncbi:nucleoside phosphatase GDA1/CD39 [Gorgonomyces haynaldii]|nr:nucleoside phosphatase GDA1/CD39 [Gorgonomyces haynaldii]
MSSGLRPQPIEGVSEWDRDRNYGVIIDAGSSGSRVYLYSWKDPNTWPKSAYPITVERGNTEFFEFKVKPGLSSLQDEPQKIGAYLKPLLEFSAKHIPPEKQSSTPIYLLATAGMRLVPLDKQETMFQMVCDFVRDNYLFSVAGGCQQHFRIISGNLEGIFGWTTVNYLKRQFHQFKISSESALPSTYGLLEMGGASTQICFEPTKLMAKEHKNDLTQLKIRYLDGTERSFGLYVHSFLGFGANEAFRKYRELNYNSKSFQDPCYPLNYQTTHALTGTNVTGTGNFDNCLQSTTPILQKELKCYEDPCLFNGVHVPLQDMRNHHFLGVSEFWYTTFKIYDKSGAYDYQALLKAARSYCSLSWNDILDKYDHRQLPHADDIPRLEEQCFKTAYIMNMLHVGLGLPKESNSNGRPIFESIDDVDGFDTSWTLGAMFLYASSSIPPQNYALSQMLLWFFFASVLGVGLMAGLQYWQTRRHYKRLNLARMMSA